MTLETALSSFTSQSLLTASRGLFKDTLHIPLSPLSDAAIEPKRFFRDSFNEKRHSGIEKLYLVGRVDDRCFQPAKEHAAAEALGLDALVEQIDVKDYSGMFIVAAELGQLEFSRSDLAARTREINRVFSNPVIVIFKHQLQKDPVISMGVIGRREHKRDKGKDVLGQVSMIREIHLQNPHRGHLEILKDFSLVELEKRQGRGKRGQKIDSFKAFHAALQEVFNTELLNKRFYNELANWYFWALPQVEFPADLEDDDEKRRATGLIRLLTRLIFCWFLKEKGLVPENLFQTADLQKVLKGFDPESETSSTYYQAILQNLFFATLNQRMGKDSKGIPHRGFARDEGFHKNKSTYDVNNLYRYEKLFAVPEAEALALFADIPFLNGGLFECLDRTEEETQKKRYLDGFSRNAKKRPHIPDRLFFDSGETADLSTAYGDKKRKAEKVSGLISILNRYKFTIVENTPIDQEIALDPELLGKVFENLLASYNEETKTTARKQTGSFYTPRPIVDYMVDESLKAHLERKLTTESTESTEQENQNSASVHSVPSVVKNSSSSTMRSKLDDLFTYTEEAHQFSAPEVATLVAAIDAVKILDPACGSGAFPMGVLHKLVYILTKLDPDNERWKATQLAKLDSAPMRDQLEAAFADNDDDYGRKLYLIENCLYGVDIQPIAIQISKLRFFISLVCDQKTNRNKKDNHGIRPLPNLETKFVAANTLIGLPIPEPDLFIKNLIEPIEKEIEGAYHSHFNIQRRDQKITLQKRIRTLRQSLSDTLLDGLGANKNSEVAKKAQHLAEWNAFDPQASADFFDPHWMFGRSLADGFDVVIGNPPYVFARDSAAKGITQEAKDYYYANYSLAEYQVNLYPIFIEAGSRVLQKEGILCFITPNNWLTINTNRKLRQFVLAQSNVSILNFYARVFESADVDAAIVIFKAGDTQSKDETVRLLEWSTEPELIINTPKSQFLSQADAIINIEALKTGGTSDLMTKIEDGTHPLKDIASVKSGLKAYEIGKGTPPQTRKMKDDRIYHSHVADLGAIKYLDGRNVCRFALGWSGEYLKYGRNLAAPRGSFDLFSTPRILVRQIPSKPPYCINACYTEETLLNDLNSMNIINILIDPKLVLAILNSRLITYWFIHKFGKMQRGIFPQFKINELAIFPMPRSFAPHEARIIELVESILAAKSENASADTSEDENEVDQLVYSLFSLTPEEVAIIEAPAK